ncbi:MAG TPA: ATP-binding cassette domain-containing protein, partial [Eudoraea sp.]|nr:ATP-binding cassette domain-containing protein [Eudoraea sp.]
QDAKISLERLSEVINQQNDEHAARNSLPTKREIVLENISFQYEGPHSPRVLHGISLKIPYNKTTAIVGASGSGKTTLLKLLLKLYRPSQGKIMVGDTPLKYVSDYHWREQCGVVMQDNYIFSDTIANNIALKTYDFLDLRRLEFSVHIANIKDWIESLPLGYRTAIGNEGIGLSQGQKQRLLIARALYKDPSYLFFDEATNSLDAKTESAIIKNLTSAISNKTLVIIAHRLSTVKYAHKIVVLDKGKIVEQGTHVSLLKNKGYYHSLVNGQL